MTIKPNQGTYEFLVREMLDLLGAEVEPIPRKGDIKQPDLLATIGSSRVVVEVKDKFDDPIERQVRSNALSSKGVHIEAQSLKYRSSIAKRISKAARQLGEFAGEMRDFRVIWFNAAGEKPDVRQSQFESTILGTERVTGAGFQKVVTCYFFHHSGFFSHHEIIDGAIVATILGPQSKVQLFLNPYSEKYQEFLFSDFAKVFGSAVLDVAREEEAGHFVLGEDADRSSEEAKLNYLAIKYSTGPLMIFPMSYFSVEVISKSKY